MAGKPRANIFERNLQGHLEKWREGAGSPTVPKWVFWKDGIYPEYRNHIERAVLDDPIALDDQIHHPYEARRLLPSICSSRFDRTPNCCPSSSAA